MAETCALNAAVVVFNIANAAVGSPPTANTACKLVIAVCIAAPWLVEADAFNALPTDVIPLVCAPATDPNMSFICGVPNGPPPDPSNGVNADDTDEGIKLVT